MRESSRRVVSAEAKFEIVQRHYTQIYPANYFVMLCKVYPPFVYQLLSKRIYPFNTVGWNDKEKKEDFRFVKGKFRRPSSAPEACKTSLEERSARFIAQPLSTLVPSHLNAHLKWPQSSLTSQNTY